MDLQRKLEILADAAKYDASCASSGSKRERMAKGVGNTNSIGICHSYTPDGRCVSLLKILLTNYCVYDCKYCINRTSNDIPRARFTPQEVVTLTVDFYKRNYIEGLFLSSGIIQNPDYTMEQLIQVARTLREEHRFGGYIHLKAAPGASALLMEEAGRWCDRLSANIELPSAKDLVQLAPGKSSDEITGTMADIKSGIEEHRDWSKKSTARSKFLPAGQSTQMIIGATPSPDADILHRASDLYKSFRLRRVYYSAYSPIPKSDPRLPAKRAPLVRENRLYQADWLIRFYGFDSKELFTPEEANLPLDKDPKLAWALRHRERFPVDVNKASKEMLLRVPGFGVRSVKRILQLRRIRSITLETLKRLGVPLEKAKYWIETADFFTSPMQLDSLKLENRVVTPTTQLSLFQQTVAGEI